MAGRRQAVQTKSSCMKSGVIIRYAVLQLLGLVAFAGALLGVRHWLLSYPLWLFWLLVAVWMAKDVALYPLVWKSYDTHGAPDPGPAVGTTGVARQTLDPCGYVEIGGELWRAELNGEAGAVGRGGKVRVTGRQGLTLFVEPEGPEP